MTALKIDHLAQPSFDAQATHLFYTEVMGFRFVTAIEGESPEWGGRFLLASYAAPEGLLVDFFTLEGMARPSPDGLPRDIRHFAFRADDRAALAAWKTRLEGQGVSYWEETHRSHDSLYFADPNDIIIEITYWTARFAGAADAAARATLARWQERASEATR